MDGNELLATAESVCRTKSLFSLCAPHELPVLDPLDLLGAFSRAATGACALPATVARFSIQ
jgi:hypothetical protein